MKNSCIEVILFVTPINIKRAKTKFVLLQQITTTNISSASGVSTHFHVYVYALQGLHMSICNTNSKNAQLAVGVRSLGCHLNFQNE